MKILKIQKLDNKKYQIQELHIKPLNQREGATPFHC